MATVYYLFVQGVVEVEYYIMSRRLTVLHLD